MTNRVWQVRGTGGPLALRVGHPRASALGVDRCREWQVLLRLRGLGIGPELLRLNTARDLTLFEWLPGPDLSNRSPDAATLRRAVSQLGRLHAQPPCGIRFSPSAMIQHYLALLDRWAEEVPRDVRELSVESAHLSLQLEGSAQPRLCHNDCVLKNWILRDDGALRLIDFEFAGDNDPAFDLATLSLDADVDFDAYPGWTHDLSTRVKAYYPVVDCVWTLYCLVLAAVDEQRRTEALRQAACRRVRLQGYVATCSNKI